MIRYADAADADLAHIKRYLTPRAGVTITSRVLNTILTSIDRLERSPMRGRSGRVAGTRELLITRYPYLVIYEVDGADVTIARIMHTRQQWPPNEDG